MSLRFWKLQECVEFLYATAAKVKKQKMGIMTPRFSVLDPLETFIESLLPEDAHECATEKLHISLTKKRKNIMISNYESRDDVIKVGNFQPQF